MLWIAAKSIPRKQKPDHPSNLSVVSRWTTLSSTLTLPFFSFLFCLFLFLSFLLFLFVSYFPPFLSLPIFVSFPFPLSSFLASSPPSHTNTHQSFGFGPLYLPSLLSPLVMSLTSFHCHPSFNSIFVLFTATVDLSVHVLQHVRVLYVLFFRECAEKERREDKSFPHLETSRKAGNGDGDGRKKTFDTAERSVCTVEAVLRPSVFIRDRRSPSRYV